jgi:hypothetical protein
MYFLLSGVLGRKVHDIGSILVIALESVLNRWPVAPVHPPVIISINRLSPNINIMRLFLRRNGTVGH